MLGIYLNGTILKAYISLIFPVLLFRRTFYTFINSAHDLNVILLDIYTVYCLFFNKFISVFIIKVSPCDEAKWDSRLRRSWKMLMIVKEVHVKSEREQLKAFLLLNRDFAYYYRDFYFYEEQTVIAAMLTVFALLKERNRVSFIQERKNSFQGLCKGFDRRFFWKFLKNFYAEYWLDNFFAPCIWFALFVFQKNIVKHLWLPVVSLNF